MMKSKMSMIGIIVCLLFFGCKSGKEQVIDKVERMKSRPIELCLDKMICRRNPLTKQNKKYTMVVYVDSTECSSCSLSKLRFWNPLIVEAKEKKVDIDYVFILSPRKAEMEDVDIELEITDLQSSIYLDTAFVFKDYNTTVPDDEKYHSFLLDKGLSMILVGSPIEDEKVKSTYNRLIYFSQN